MKNTQENIALPDFDVTLVLSDPHQDGDTSSIRLDEWQKTTKQGLILYFYPKDSTQGCTTQAHDFTAMRDDFTKLGYQVLGVSRDGIKSHQNFIAKKELGIGLISDTNEQLCTHFDVIKEKMMYGKTHLGVVRSTFVYDKGGNMVASFRNVKAKDHANALLDFLKNL